MNRCYLLTLATVLTCGTAAAQSAVPAPSDKVPPYSEVPLAGYRNGQFFLRTQENEFNLFFNARVNVDGATYHGPGVGNTQLYPTVLLRRSRLEAGGAILKNWQWEIGLEGGPTAFDNADGSAEKSASSPGQDPTSASARYSPVENPAFRGGLQEAYINYQAGEWLNVLAGQASIPFTMENRTATNTTTFMERAMPVRAIGAPNGQDIGLQVWGGLPKNLVFYSFALVNGEGQNRPNADENFDVVGRVYTRPLANVESPLPGLQIGMSASTGKRGAVGYDLPAMSTQGGYQFWIPTYRDSRVDPRTNQGTFVHVVPAGQQAALAGELRVPFDRFDLRGELIWISNPTVESSDGFQLKEALRRGKLEGIGSYVQLSWWFLGDAFVNGAPGDRNVRKLNLGGPEERPKIGTELAVKWEHLALTYKSADKQGTPDPKGIDGDIRVEAFGAALNHWMTRSVRLSLNYGYYAFPDSGPDSATTTGGATWTSSNRARAPGNTLAKGVNDSARNGAHDLHEVMARVGLCF